jgi:cytochrome c556
MIRRTWVASISLFGLVGTVAALAQTDPIAARRAIEHASGEAQRLGTAMVQGEVPFEVAKAKAIFATFVDAATKMPQLFPDNAKTGGETAAAPKVWEDRADFVARWQNFGAEAKAAADATTDLDSFRRAFSRVNESCASCHDLYRVKKS